MGAKERQLRFALHLIPAAQLVAGTLAFSGGGHWR
jgi:hypothetical protein